MDELFEIIFARSIIRFIGKKVRFYFFLIIGKPKSYNFISGISKNNSENFMRQDFYNAVVGMVIFIIISIIGAIFIYS